MFLTQSSRFITKFFEFPTKSSSLNPISHNPPNITPKTSPSKNFQTQNHSPWIHPPLIDSKVLFSLVKILIYCLFWCKMITKLINTSKCRLNIAKTIRNRRCHSSGKITIDDVVFEKSSKSTRPEFVPRKFCKLNLSLKMFSNDFTLQSSSPAMESRRSRNPRCTICGG